MSGGHAEDGLANEVSGLRPSGFGWQASRTLEASKATRRTSVIADAFRYTRATIAVIS
jgi:hypothetical protein